MHFFNVLNIELLKMLTLYPRYNSLTVEYGINNNISLGVTGFVKNNPGYLSQDRHCKDLLFFIKRKIYENKKSVISLQAKTTLINLYKTHLVQEYSMLMGRTSFFRGLKFVHSTEFSVGFPKSNFNKALYIKRDFTELVEWKKFTLISQSSNYSYRLENQHINILSQQISLAKLLSINNFEFTGQVGYFVERQAKRKFKLANGVFFSLWIK